MPTAVKTAAQTWIRAELVGVPDSAFGPQLMIPADGVEFHGPDLVFHREGEVVYVTRPDQLRSLTWLGPTTDPERERRRAQWPNHGKRWTDEQRERLRAEILAGTEWTQIAKTHGRSRAGVQQEAVKQGWVDAETLRPADALLGGEGGVDAAEGDGTIDTAPDQSPGSSLPVRLLGSYVTTALPPPAAALEGSPGIDPTDPAAFRDPSVRPPFPDDARLAAAPAPPPGADPLSPSSLPAYFRDGATGATGVGRPPGQESGRAAPPRPPEPAPPAIPHPREPDRMPPDDLREPARLAPARLTPARPPGT